MRVGIYIAVLFWAVVVHTGSAQKRMQVITRITEETYEFSNDFLLEVDGEKANITLKQGEPGKVHVVLKQVVKNTSREVAESDLKAHKFTFNKERERLYVRNYILFDESGNGNSSIFSSQYEITVPPTCFLKIKNTLGDIDIAGISGKLSVDVEIGKLTINESSLEVDGKIQVGDLTFKNSNLQTNIQLNNVISRINGCAGTLGIKANFGSISMVTTQNLSSINIEAENTEVTLVNKENYVYNYFVKSKNGSINLLTNENITKEGDYNIFKTVSDNSVGDIIITSDYGDVSIY